MTRIARFQTPVRLVIATLGVAVLVPINLGPDAVIVGTLSGR